MCTKEINRQEYNKRIIRAMDYVNTYSHRTINLAELAEVAMFSSFHFHRIFTLIVQETPNQFVSRIRLEKAARLLHRSPNLTISEIALNCGFESVSSFSRAFKKHYTINAKAYRQEAKGIYAHQGVRYSKIGQAVSKIGQHKQPINKEFCLIDLKQLIFMDTKIEIKQLPVFDLICYRQTGNLEQIAQAFNKLFQWAAPRGLVNEHTTAISIYHDDPAVTTAEKLRNDVGIIVSPGVIVDGEIRKVKTEAGKYAVGSFEIHQSEFEKAWNTMYAWLSESGFQPREASPFELYHNDHKQHPEKKFSIDICIPIKPL